MSGGASISFAQGSVLIRSKPSLVLSSYLYSVPTPMPGTNSSQMPVGPSERIGKSRPSQLLNSPTTLTRLRVRRPDRERRSGHAVLCPQVRAEHRPQLAMRPLTDEVQVELAQAGQEAIRIFAFPSRAVAEAKNGADRPAGP